MDLLSAYQFLDNRISALEEDLENCEDRRRYSIEVELENFKNLKECIEQSNHKMTLQKFLAKIEIPTGVRLTKNGQRLSGRLSEARFRKILKRYEDNEVVQVATRRGLKYLDEEENEPYIEIKIRD